MKIRCGSHQQNRSIVRPGLSLMAAKVALTAEEFRENSQRSIALFNTEKLSTNSTHVLKSAYCNSVHFCRCNLHGACGGKAPIPPITLYPLLLQSARSVWRQSSAARALSRSFQLQSARSVWRQRYALYASRRSPCGLQSARSVWRQRLAAQPAAHENVVAICTERVEAKPPIHAKRRRKPVAICTERVEAKLPFSFGFFKHCGCNLHGACGGKDLLTEYNTLTGRCNLHGACGGKAR